MSVVVVVRLKVDPSGLEETFRSQKDTFHAVSAEAKTKGAIHHQFVAGDGEVLIIDEWDTAEHFQEFFGNQPQIAELMQQAGVAGPPEVSVYKRMDSPDTF